MSEEEECTADPPVCGAEWFTGPWSEVCHIIINCNTYTFNFGL